MHLTRLEGLAEALENDVRALYGMVPDRTRSHDGKLSPEQRLKALYAEMQVLALELNVQL
jgi:hypothetical protein